MIAPDRALLSLLFSARGLNNLNGAQLPLLCIPTTVGNARAKSQT